jgi:hypothetical protein
MMGGVAAVAIGVWHIALEDDPVFRLPWPAILGAAAAGCAVRAALELVRPVRGTRTPAPAEDVSALRELVSQKLRGGAPWVHWELQNPAWLNVLMAVAVGVLLVGAAAVWREEPLLTPVMLAPAIIAFACYGGLRVVVTPARLALKLGLLGLTLLSVRIEDLSSAEVMEFSPLRDFYGWGPGRYSFRLGMWGFFMRGTRGVRIETTKGKKYLLGSDHPDRTAAVIAAVIAARGA